MTEGPRDVGPNSSLEDVGGIPGGEATGTSAEADQDAGLAAGGDEAVSVPDGAETNSIGEDTSHGADVDAAYDDDDDQAAEDRVGSDGPHES